MKTHEINEPDYKGLVSPAPSLHDFFVAGLKDIYWAELAQIEMFPFLIENTTSEALREILEDHFDLTEVQVKRIEEIFMILDLSLQAEKCDAMEGILIENKKMIGMTEVDTELRDVALICGMQKIEHYEITTYGSLRALAATLEYEDVSDLLKATLDEESEMDEILTRLAESSVNEDAKNEFNL